MKGFVHTLILLSLATAAVAQKDCRFQEYEEKVMTDNPGLLSGRLERAAFSMRTQEQPVVLPEVIVVPVVVHILYNKAEQNISNEQVMSQIEVLNNDFRGLNKERKQVPSYFAGLAADCGIEFKLASLDANGLPTTGIVRKQTSIQYFGIDDRAKTPSRGGDQAWDASRYLNIWVCNLAGGILGYSSTPGGPADKDGIVIHHEVFGTIGNLKRPFNLGRTATHEVGHWLNLRHIWGDSYCGDDKVDDTPQQSFSNKGCPATKKYSCGNGAHGDMYMNFMDLTDDACMYMFTEGQKRRMRAEFQPGGLRHAMLTTKTVDSPVVRASLPKMAFFPNPVTNLLTIKLPEADKDRKIQSEIIVYNHVGVPVLRDVMQAQQKSLLVAQLKPGLYYVHVIDGNTRTITKVLKR